VSSIEPSTNGRTLLLIDGDEPCSRPDALVVRWSSPEAMVGEHALPALVERIALELRSEYLSWAANLAEAPTGRGPLAQALRIRALGGVPFWPLTLIAEKAPFKDAPVYPVFKLRALERLYQSSACRGIEYAGNDRRLHTILQAWCDTLGHSYRRAATRQKRAENRPWHRRLPAWLQALLFLGRLWWTRCRPLARKRPRPLPTGDIIIITYFPNVDTNLAARGEFRSRYWEGFHDVLKEQGLRTDWVWIYVSSEKFDYGASLRLRDEFDRAAGGKQHHYLLHELLTPRALLRVMLGFAELYLKGLTISRAARRAFRFPGSAMNLFPLFAEEWRDGIFGKRAIEGLLYFAMFRELASRNGAACVFYVWENQGWEKALIAACRQVSAARLVGCQHATLPPLDLRAFPTDGDEFVPDLLAVNGAAAQDEMLQAGFPEHRLRTVTALRYSHLTGIRGSQARVLPQQERTLLVIGGYLHTETRHQLDLLRATAPELARYYGRCIVKPHPFYTGALAEELAPLPIAVEIAQRPLAELWPEADVVYCANSTSAAVEAAWICLPLIISSAGDGMNLSPLFGWPGLEFVTDAATLAKQLENPDRIELPDNYFRLDDNLNSWRKIFRECRRSR